MSDWVPCRDYGVAATISSAGFGGQLDFLLLRHGSVVGVQGDAQLDVAPAITVQRMIGQMEFDGYALSAQTLICMRLRVALYDEQTDQTAYFANSLFDEDGAEEAFLWQRYFRMQPESNTLDPLMHPWWTSLIDVRVARKIPRDQALFLTVQAASMAVGDAVRVIPFLRSYARSS